MNSTFIKKKNMNYNFFYPTIGIFIALLLTFSIIPGYLGFAIIVAILIYVSIKRIDYGINLTLVIIPFVELIRNANQNSILLAGISTIMLFLLISIYLAHFLINKNGISKLPGEIIGLLIFSFWVLLNLIVSIGDHSVFDAFMASRFYLIPILFFFLVYSSVRKSPFVAYHYLVSLILSGVTVACLHLCKYYNLIVVPYNGVPNDYIINGGRTLGQIFFKRGVSLIGGGPSTAAIFFIFIAFLSLINIVIVYQKGAKRLAVFNTILVVVSTWASVTLVSISMLFFVVAALFFYLLLRMKISIKSSIIVLASLVATFVLLYYNLFNHTSIIDIIKNFTFVWTRYFPTGLSSWVFGQGIYANTSGGISDKLLDGGWIAILNVLGIFGTSLFFYCFLGAIIGLVKKYRSEMKKKYFANSIFFYILLASATGTFALLISSVHTAIIVLHIMNYVFYALFAMSLALLYNTNIKINIRVNFPKINSNVVLGSIKLK